MSQPFAHFGRALTLLRIQAGLTQKDLAERAGITPSMISEYEASKKRPHLDTLDKILVALGADVHELAATLHRAQREEIVKALPPPVPGYPLSETGVDSYRARALRLLAEAGGAFDGFTRAFEDFLLATAAADTQEEETADPPDAD